ncbi:uncharacterized protein LOC105186896 [Harpegnathos saltator]|uniref:uncharacterized protein LOC105186896 n=1 Tax=Harpegnathos saltator TaxID=610380 RepID=UPI000DBEEA2E|nr:uncharacterized protein LOC105186896 [Harpegnathos saltator]
MAARNRRAMGFLVYVYLGYLLLARVQSNPVNIPVNQVPLTLWERAWSALNEHSPTHHLYAQGNLINAQELVEPPYKIYKFTYNLSPICGAESPVSGSPCPKEACTIDLKQDENGEIETLNDSIQCMYFYPADAQNEVSQEQQGDQSTSYQEQEDSQVTESLAEQVNNNRSVELYHEVQETGDENVRPFIAMRASNPSYCPGCPYELNPQLMGLLPFSKQALKSMDEQSTGDYKHKLIKIVKVTRSVPVSSNVIQYQLLLLIGESECLKNALEQDECPLQVDVPAKLCLITFEQQPWQQTGLKITKNNCTSPENVSSSNNLSQQPDSESLSQMTVKYDEGQPLKDAYEGLKDILDNYTHAPTSPEISSESKETSSKRAVTEPTIVKILLNRSQDDEKNEGFFDKTKEFGEFLEDFDVPVKVEHVTPESMKEGEFKRKKVRAENFMVEKAIDRNVVNRQKRSPQVQLVGAPSPISVNDSDVQMYVEKALRKVSHDSDEPNEPIIVEIVKATVQVVAGSLHKITVKMGTSDCPKGTKNNCQLQAGSEVKDCQISVLSQSWLDKGEPSITVECPPPPEMVEKATDRNVVNRQKRSPQVQLVGAPSPISVNDSDVQIYVEKALRKVSHDSDEPNEPIVVEIVKATVQVVAGSLHKITVKMGTSDCPKGTKNNCQLQAGSEVKDCQISVLSQPWLDKGEPSITVECPPPPEMVEKATDRNVVNRQKRSPQVQLLGAPSPISVNDSGVQMYVEKALRKVSHESNEPNEPIVVEIVKATVQTVAGRLHKITVRMGTSNCPKGTKNNCQLQAGSEVKDCQISVLSQPWLDNGEPSITVECPPPEKSHRKERSLRGTNYNEKMLRIAEDMRSERLFENFVNTYNRTYATEEERNLRLSIFRENLGIIRLLRKNEQGTGQYGVNQFADVSTEEFHAFYLGLRPDLRTENNIPLRQAEIPDIELPNSFDWRQKGAVTPVKNQGMCGSCWAFSVTGNVEGQYAIKHNKLLSLSEQELVDCDDLDEGCNGGLPDNAYRAIEKLGGLELESDYPYEAENERCHFKKNMAKVQVGSAVNITSNETQIAQWLVANGPISIGINANAMQFYMGGVSHPFKFLCNPKNLDHGVLIVGYGTSNYPLFHKKLPYWIVKNSWGDRWGEQGYYRVYRGDGTCGLNTMASSAVVV